MSQNGNRLTRDDLVGTTDVYLPELGGAVKVRPLDIATQRGLGALVHTEAPGSKKAQKMVLMMLIIQRGLIEPELSRGEVREFVAAHPAAAARLLKRIMALTE